MKAVKGQGRSVVESKDLKTRSLQRVDKEGNKNTVSFRDFAEEESQFIIALWISVIDKIISKPIKNPKKAEESKNACAQALRQRIGDAVLSGKMVRARRLTVTQWWDWKIKAKSTGKQKPDFPKGRWYKAFLGDKEMNEINDEQITELVHDIDKHIYQATRSFERSADKSGSKGLLADMLKAIEKNTLKAAYEKQFIDKKKKDGSFTKEDWETYCAKASQVDGGDFAKALKQAIQNKDNKISPYHRAVEFLKKDVWAKVFGAIGRKEAKEQFSELLAVHDVIREFYKKTLKGRNSIALHNIGAKERDYKKATGKNREEKRDKNKDWVVQAVKQKLKYILPNNTDELRRSLCKKNKNIDVNHYIRLGKILHYEASRIGNKNKKGDQDSTAYIIKNWDSATEKLPESSYWSSEGQTYIKQNEAFIRVWRRTLAFAVHSLKNWAEPKNKVQGDATIGDTWTEIQKHWKFTDNIFTDNFKQKYTLLFGKKWQSADSEKDIKEVLDYLQKRLMELRGAVFHFKGMNKFVSELKTKKPLDLMKNIYEEDCKAYRAKPLQIMQSAKFERFFTKEQIEDMLRAVQEFDAVSVTDPKGDDGQQLPLPTLKRVLMRVKNTWNEKADDNIKLPPYDSAAKKNEKADKTEGSDSRAEGAKNEKKETSEEEERKDARHAQYIAIKQLYELPFRAWLAELPPEKINTYIDCSVKHATEAARKDEQDEAVKSCITAKAKNLPRLAKGDRVDRFFYNLMAETASEMRVQKDYQSDGEQAKKQAEYIEKLKCDVVAYALADYVQEQHEVREKGKQSKTVYFKYLLRNVEGEGEAKGKAEEAFLLKQDEVKKEDKLEKWSDVTIGQNEAWDKLLKEGGFQPWLYFLLHLAPVEEVASLRQQIRKWQIVVSKSENTDDKLENERRDAAKTRPLLQVLNLYIELHDEQFNRAVDDQEKDEQNQKKDTEKGKFLDEDRKQLLRYYADEKVYKAVVSRQENNADNKQIIRGLREMRRFGGDTVLDGVLGEDEHKISQRHIDAWKETENKIAEAQKTRKDLHKKWVDLKNKSNKNNLGKEDKKNYADALGIIKDHGNAVAQVELQNHLNLHKLLLVVLGRLIDFSGLFERDLYFTMLALFYENKGNKIEKLEDKFLDKGDLLKKGRIPEAFAEQLPEGDEKERLKKIFNLTAIPGKGETEQEKYDDLANKDVRMWIRNRFAHLAVLEVRHITENEPPKCDVDLTRELNFARALMSYDRKLKNAVSQSVVEMLARHKLEILWQMKPEEKAKQSDTKPAASNPADPVAVAYEKIKSESGHYLHEENVNVEARIIHHLGDNRAEDLTENLQSAEFVSMVQRLFGGVNKIKAEEEAKAKAQAERQKRQEEAKKQGKQSGVVESFKTDKSFGFIKPDDNSAKVFFHKSALTYSDQKKLQKGQGVIYKTEKTEQGKLKAVNISVIG